ncbi:MAG: purine-nucleoside phosphorylase [Bacteroidota bacterium]
MQEKLQEAFEYVSKQISSRPKIGIVLGTGLGRLVEEIDQEKALPYNFIPHFPISTVESHFGKLIFGKIGDKEVVAMQGRFHYYEGYNMQEITFPIRMMKMLGVETLFISNASGAVNLSFQNGDLMVIDDHINLQPANPLTGPNISEFGPRFPDMSAPYDKELSARAMEIAKENDIRAHIGVYVGVPGPNLETRAEYRYMRIIGGDVVGMSTVPEVIVARHMDMRVCAISVITDIGDPDNLHPISLEDVIAVANEAEPKLTHLLSTLIKEL